MKNKNILWGILFIMIGVFVLFQRQFEFFHISVWTVVFTIVFSATLVASLKKMQWFGILFSLAFLVILYADAFHISFLAPWPVLWAAFFGSIGMSMIFHKPGKKKETYFGEKFDGQKVFVKECAENEVYRCEAAFCNTVKYADCSYMKLAMLENSFAKLTVYFDHVVLKDGLADMRVENSFGETVLFLPKEWQVQIVSEQNFGSVNIHGACAEVSENLLRLEAETNFGSIEINYI